MIELRGRKVVLRTLERAHCRELWDAYEPAEPLPTEPLNPGLSSEGADRWFEEMQARQGREHVYLGIFSLDGRLLGDIQLADINWRDRVASLGVGITRQADRGKGHAADAVRSILGYGFEHLNLARIEARTAAYNLAAQRLLEACGFQREGVRRLAVFRGGRRWDEITYGLLAPELAERGCVDHR
ncbi:MAG: GNAT family N-acetyltransferase [Anaerolineae bacterium]|nr:GNAT family N-acetyltransferase [Anaerolineae bacterium]